MMADDFDAPPGVRVNELTWRFYPEGNIGGAEWLASQSIDAHYFRVREIDGGWCYGSDLFGDLEAAKAAAQADYSDRVLAHLVQS